MLGTGIVKPVLRLFEARSTSDTFDLLLFLRSYATAAGRPVPG